MVTSKISFAKYSNLHPSDTYQQSILAASVDKQSSRLGRTQRIQQNLQLISLVFGALVFVTTKVDVFAAIQDLIGISS